MNQVYAVGRSSSRVFLIHLDSKGGVGSTGSFADNEKALVSDNNRELLFAIGASDDAVFATLYYIDKVRCRGSEYKYMLMRLVIHTIHVKPD